VATELPEKVDNVQHCEMSAEQEKKYEEVKSQYRNQILENITEPYLLLNGEGIATI